jgi:hypothetical protein
MKERCPPHKFKAAWSSGDDNKGVIFCRACGDIRELVEPAVSAPAEETVTASYTLEASDHE